MSICSKISREKLYNRNYEPDETIGLHIGKININKDYNSLVTLLGTIYIQYKGGQKDG
ncbi:hypothetical protein [Sedimentibacter saalensis]|uniref:Uncharacterized protein n=1 Tax=Sedimentibacter saalensis TaxID=130788 RepID=A0A562JHT5_9FIRM|nr:hypothetical protein [Sedimentibacter saalensis]TWH82563.1 hypothetical protein LY60_00864 [Sedimentibacter saalensis]